MRLNEGYMKVVPLPRMREMVNSGHWITVLIFYLVQVYHFEKIKIEPFRGKTRQ